MKSCPPNCLRPSHNVPSTRRCRDPRAEHGAEIKVDDKRLAVAGNRKDLQGHGRTLAALRGRIGGTWKSTRRTEALFTFFLRICERLLRSVYRGLC
jgi:hypothetical protein